MILISGIQQENRHIRALQQENKELRAALEEHQNAIELIMSKYRQHMNHLLHQTRLDSSFIVNREKAAVSAHNFNMQEVLFNLWLTRCGAKHFFIH